MDEVTAIKGNVLSAESELMSIILHTWQRAEWWEDQRQFCDGWKTYQFGSVTITFINWCHIINSIRGIIVIEKDKQTNTWVTMI